MTSSWFTISTTRNPSIPASLEYLISTSCSKLSQSVDIISHVKYLDVLRKYCQDSSKFRIVIFFSICHTYYAHTRVPRAYTKELIDFRLNSQTVYRQLSIYDHIQETKNMWGIVGFFAITFCILLWQFGWFCAYFWKTNRPAQAICEWTLGKSLLEMYSNIHTPSKAH